jgi:muramoyltetrapeptide carboxypeptidase
VTQMDIGHTQPFLPLVNGASARVVVGDGVREVTQTLG